MYNAEAMEHSKAAFGIFRSNKEVRIAKAILNSLGFTNSDIAVLYPPHPGAQDFPQHQNNSVKKGALLGAAIGGVVVFFISLLITSRMNGLAAANSLAMPPNLGDLFFLNLVGLISGIVLGAACGALAGIGIPERAGQRYGDYIDAGGILMSVHVEDDRKARAAQDVLEHTGAQDINLIKEKEGWDLVYTKMVENNRPKIPPVNVDP